MLPIPLPPSGLYTFSVAGDTSIFLSHRHYSSNRSKLFWLAAAVPAGIYLVDVCSHVVDFSAVENAVYSSLRLISLGGSAD